MPLDFREAGTSIVTVPDATSIQDIFVGGGTVMFWHNAAQLSGNTRIIHKGPWNIFFPSRIAFVQDFSGDQGRWNADIETSPINTWHHAAIVYDSSSAANDAQIFIDGVEQPIDRQFTPTGVVTSDVGFDITLANFEDLTRSFNGLLEDVQMFRRMLSEAEINALYHSNAALQPYNDMEMRLRMFGVAGDVLSTSGTPVIDESGNGNDGSVSGTVTVRGSERTFGRGGRK